MLKVLLKFLSVGAISTLVQYILLVVFVELINLDIVLSSSLAYGFSSIFNYLANFYLTFHSESTHIEAASKFIAVVLVGLLLNAVCMYLFVVLSNIPYLISQVVSTLVVLVWNFTAHKQWTYAKRKGDSNG